MKWEYYTFKLEAGRWFFEGELDQVKLAAELNRLGDLGWELVSVFDTNRNHGITRDVHVVLKRAKER